MSFLPSSVLPQLIQKVFTQIKLQNITKNSTKIDDEDLIELRSLFGHILLEEAFHIIDTAKIVCYRSENPFRELIEIISRNGDIYKLFPNINYCQCLGFKYEVIYSRNQYTCKHVLAIKLADILEKIEQQILPVEKINILLKELTNHEV